MATEAAWLNGNNLEKEEIKKKKKEKKKKKRLTLTGLLMEGVNANSQYPFGGVRSKLKL